MTLQEEVLNSFRIVMTFSQKMKLKNNSNCRSWPQTVNNIQLKLNSLSQKQIMFIIWLFMLSYRHKNKYYCNKNTFCL